MAKKIQTVLKLQVKAGQANPAPPIGPALGQHGINIGDFCNQFNAATKDKGEDIIPVEIRVYADRSFDFTLKTPPAAYLLKKAAGIEKGASEPNKREVGTVTRNDLRSIAEQKMEDLNANDVEAAMNIIEGTARNMGIKIVK